MNSRTKFFKSFDEIKKESLKEVAISRGIGDELFHENWEIQFHSFDLKYVFCSSVLFISDHRLIRF